MKNEEVEQMIEKSFGAEPEYYLPSDFAKKVANIIQRRELTKSNFQECIYIAVISIFLLAIAPCIYYFFDPEVLLNSFNFIKENPLPVVFIVIILGFILFADRVFLPFLFSRYNRG